MKEQSQIQFYDKLLSHLNKTFVANLKTQELYLDLTRNTRQLRFKSIKNIYYTLTEGKADQIIYHKHKPLFTKSQIYDQSYTKRTCWRVIQKLITKIAYYLTYERGLSELAPTILRAVNYTRKATDKITNKASFMQFYSQVLDLLIEQNNLLAKKIYALLIDRGYIYSIDEFYKLSRFQDNKDFVYQLGDADKGQNGEPKVVPKVEDRDEQFKKTFMGKRRGFRGSLLQNFGTRFSQLAKETIEIKQYEKESQASEEQTSQISQSSQSAQSQQQQQLQKSKVNKLNHTIHTQIQKVIDQFVTHPNYQLFLASINEDEKKECNSPKKRKEPVVKQIIKNIRIKNYKANQKILEMNQNTFPANQSDRKNSYQSMTESKKSKRSRLKKGNAALNNRTSIATAVNKMVRENVFKKQGVQGVQELLISNLEKTLRHKHSDQSQLEESRKILYQSKKQSQKKMRRQNSYNGDVHYAGQFMKNKLGRKVSSIQFFSNAFIFKQGEESKCYIKKTDKMGHPHSICGEQEFKSIQSIFNRKHNNKLRISQPTRRQLDEGQLFHNQKLTQFNKFYQQGQSKLNKKGRNPLTRRQKQKFNTTMLELAAKKYHKYLPEQQVVRQNNRIQKIDFSKVFVKNQEQNHSPLNKMIECGSSKRYLHKRKFEVFDRRNRKIL